MKIKFLSVALLVASLSTISCNKKADETTEPAVQEVVDTTTVVEQPIAATTATATEEATNSKDGEMIEVTGKVTEIVQGKDGYMAKLTTADDKKYTATISIPNLDNPKQFRAVKVGDNITVKGEVTNLESDVLIRVKELK